MKYLGCFSTLTINLKSLNYFPGKYNVVTLIALGNKIYVFLVTFIKVLIIKLSALLGYVMLVRPCDWPLMLRIGPLKCLLAFWVQKVIGIS